MKKYLILGLVLCMPFMASAEELTCPEGQKVASVLVSEGSEAVPAVTHTEYRWRLTSHSSWSSWSLTDNAPHWVSSHNKQTKTVVDEEAVPAVPPVYEDQCVEDPEYVPPAPEPEPAPVKKVETPQPGGSRRPVLLADGTYYCPQPLRRDSDPMRHCEGKYIDSPKFGGSPQAQLNYILSQLLAIMEKLQALN